MTAASGTAAATPLNIDRLLSLLLVHMRVIVTSRLVRRQHILIYLNFMFIVEIDVTKLTSVARAAYVLHLLPFLCLTVRFSRGMTSLKILQVKLKVIKMFVFFNCESAKGIINCNSHQTIAIPFAVKENRHLNA